MSTWLYPISKRSGREFWLDDGTRLKVSVDSYAKLVKNGRLSEDKLWGVSTNFRTAQINDEVFIYTGDQNLGIIGYAKITKVEREKDPAFYLRFDLKKCAALLAAPVSALVVRKWPRLRLRRAVENLTPHLPKLKKFLPWIKSGRTTLPTRLAKMGKSVGAGFNVDQKQLRKVEKAAIRAATDYYRKQGWEVVSVEQQKLGFDLLCSKGSQARKVEVKGISGNGVSFIITAGERRMAKNKDFILCVVSNALSKQPVIKIWTGRQMEKNFAFAEINYLASLRS